MARATLLCNDHSTTLILENSSLRASNRKSGIYNLYVNSAWISLVLFFFNPKIRVLREGTRASRVQLLAERTATNFTRTH